MFSLCRTLMALPLLALALPALANDLETALRDAFDAGDLPGLHAVLVRQGGATGAEVYFTGQDEIWGAPVGIVAHGPETLHDVRSISKSVTSLLYGIALDKGLVPPPNAALLAQFPEHADLSDPLRDRITIGHVLSMTSGLHWNESLPYTDPRNSEIAMERAPDRVRFVLGQPMMSDPGTVWTYSGGSTALLGELIRRGTGQSLEAFAARQLFGPLGITDTDWVAGSDGHAAAASGLRLRARDLARIGEMIARGGRVDGRRIVSAEWLRESFTARASTGLLRYGYQWWLAPSGTPLAWFAGMGHGGQRISINPALDLVIVVFAGNYNTPQDWRLPVTVITDFIEPALGLR